MINIVMDYMLSQDEQKELIKLLEKDEKKLTKLRKKLVKSKNQSKDIKNYLIPKINTIIEKRSRILLTDEEKINSETEIIIKNGELSYEM